MEKRKYILALIVLIVVSFIIKLIFILEYKNSINLASDDLNYIKSAVVLLKKGIFTYGTYGSFTEPTVFIMPLYPLFIAAFLKLFGFGVAGLQAVRIFQAVLSCVTILMVYLIAKQLFDRRVALFSAILVSFYMPNIVSAGYMLTETLFTTLLMLLVYFSLRFSPTPGYFHFVFLGVLWALATMVRPTIALFPVILFPYLLLYYRHDLFKLVKLGAVMLIPFLIIMSPWWARNYIEYGKFIPLSASSGNPMLQGTYINYRQTPENTVYYKLGKNAFETNQTEIEVAKKRIKEGFSKDFWRYLAWYTAGKTGHFWGGPFYWQRYFGISYNIVLAYHIFLLSGFIGILTLFTKGFLKYMLPLSIMLYFNIVHCVFMAFDRYAFPLIPLLTIFTAYLWLKIYFFIRRTHKKPVQT